MVERPSPSSLYRSISCVGIRYQLDIVFWYIILLGPCVDWGLFHLEDLNCGEWSMIRPSCWDGVFHMDQHYWARVQRCLWMVASYRSGIVMIDRRYKITITIIRSLLQEFDPKSSSQGRSILLEHDLHHYYFGDQPCMLPAAKCSSATVNRSQISPLVGTGRKLDIRLFASVHFQQFIKHCTRFPELLGAIEDRFRHFR